MIHPVSNRSALPSAGGLPPALSLNSEPQTLNPSSGKNTPELHKAFTDFVGQTFFGEMLKQMRSTVHKSEWMHGGMGEDVFQTQLDQVLVERISDASATNFTEPMFDLLMARRS